MDMDKPLLVRFDEKQRKRLKKMADFYGLSESSFIRWYIFKDSKEIMARQ